MEQPRDYYYKVIVVGINGVGKTCYIRKLVHDTFNQEYKCTIGVDFSLKTFNVGDDAIVRLQLYDIAGQELFGQMTRVYYKESYAAFVVMDVSQVSEDSLDTDELDLSLENAIKWKKDIDRKVYIPGTTEPIPTVLLANKCDLIKEENRERLEKKLDAFCAEYGFVKYFLTSAQDGTNVNEAARFIVDHILEIDPQTQAENDSLDISGGSKGSGGCC
ncbi:ras-related protein Rab-32 [Carpediemonas membranifera]|uniref:Ras-related protein Rab-32 n=1 Tax=Carpediemonas membranifera TaxID=201153 RepID=A0A8J6EAI6_9EUKA|nr:ras-related protein Rab-32 [Carpediemonas membranifera]|eukprot:KAG9394750.1 ras-related protein Rab-32 [Carpediemonas membranifera]